MPSIIPALRFAVKQRLYKELRRCRDARTRTRYLIILNLSNGKGAYPTAEVLGIHNTTVYRVAKGFREHGEEALWDRREDNGEVKLTEYYLSTLYKVVRSNPRDHHWRRPTWTRELLVETMLAKTGVRIHVATMSRALAMIKARRGRPRPTVRCPWSKWAKTRRLNKIRQLLANLPKDEVVLYADEVDVHLNPKIGLDWMVRGQQKEALTPGVNQKRYLAGALERNKRLVWVEGKRKDSGLFIDLLDALAKAYPKAKKIHLILDNYRIHDSKIVQAALRRHEGRIERHFLPPYCPDENKIERFWQDLHAEVTRNHRCSSMDHLMLDVQEYMERRTRDLQRQSAKAEQEAYYGSAA
jgi:transposase